MARPKEALIKPAQVTAMALAIIDRDGLDAFNLRRLAQALGVNPSSLYHHFRDKDDILLRVCRLVLDQGQVVTVVRADSRWQDYVKEMIGRYRKALMQHPNVAPLMNASPQYDRFRDPLGQRAMRALLADGVPRKYVYALVDSVNTLAYGSALLNPNDYTAGREAMAHAEDETVMTSDVLRSTEVGRATLSDADRCPAGRMDGDHRARTGGRAHIAVEECDSQDEGVNLVDCRHHSLPCSASTRKDG